MPGENYTVQYNVKVNSKAAENALTSFATATTKLTEAQTQLENFAKKINQVSGMLSKMSKTAPTLRLNTGTINRQLDTIIHKLEKIHTLSGGSLIMGGAGGGLVAAGNSKPASGNTGASKPNKAPAPKGGGQSSAKPAPIIRNQGRGGTRYQALGQTLIDTGGVGVLDFMKGMGIAYGISGLGSLIGGVVRDSVNYNNIMQTTKNILGSHDPDKLTFDQRFRNMEDIVRQVGIETKFTAPQVADASKFLAMAGFDINAINKSIRPIADIALIGDNDLGETADVVTNIMTGFGISPDQIRRAADIMTNTFTMSNTTLMEIAESYKYAGSLLARNGTSFEEATAAIGILGDAGIKGSQAGTTLRTMALNIAKPTKAQREMWEKLGIERKDENGNIRPMVDLFQELSAQNLTLEQFGALFHKTAASGASALAANVDKWNKIIEENFMSDGMTSKLADAKKNTIEGLWYQLTSSFTEAGMQAFEQMEAPIRDMLNKIIVFLQSDTFKNDLKHLGTTIWGMAETVGKLTLRLIDLYKRFEPLILMWLKLQLYLKMVLIPLRVVSSLLNFGKYAVNEARSIAQLAVRFSTLSTNIWKTVHATASLNAVSNGSAIAGTGANAGRTASLFGAKRPHSFAVWNRWSRMNPSFMSGASGIVGGALGAYLGAGLGPEGSGWSVVGSLGGTVLGSMLGLKLPAILGALGAAASAAIGVIAALGVAVGVYAHHTHEATAASEEWAASFSKLGIDKLNYNSTEAVLIGNMRIYNSLLDDQNEKVALSISLYDQYWKKKNGEDKEPALEKAFVDTEAGTGFAKWMKYGKSAHTFDFENVLSNLDAMGFGDYSKPESYGYRHFWNNTALHGSIADFSSEGAATVQLMRLAADPSNPANKALEEYLLGSIFGASSANVARRYQTLAAQNFIPGVNSSLNPSYRDLRSMTWADIQTTSAYNSIWGEKAQKMISAYDPFIQAMQEYDTSKVVNNELIESWLPTVLGPTAESVFKGFGSDAWKRRIVDIAADPTKYGIEQSAEKFASETLPAMLETLFTIYKTVNTAYQPLLAGYFNPQYWNGVGIDGLKIPQAGTLNSKGQVVQDANGTNTTGGTSGGNGGYTNQYRSSSATPKQIIVKIENLMNVENVDMTDPQVSATVNNLKEQMAQALIDVVHDFDASMSN